VTDPSARASLAGSFGAAAGQYERGRPTYPAEAIDWLLPPAARRVLDLGAGTGKLTRDLLARGLDVIAVEPSDRMRARLTAAVPEAATLDGRAEAIPLPDASMDAVLVAQAWHWVDPARAVPEVARVLAADGRLGLVWNVRDEQASWVAALSRLLQHDADHHPSFDVGHGPAVGPPFGPLQHAEVTWTHRLRRQQVVDLVASRSYVITLPPGRRAELLRAVLDLLDTHADVAGRSEVDLPYRTHCYRTTRA
jgi:SAM-dependent methyltransferase